MASLDPNITEVIGAFALMIGGFFAIAKLMLNQATKDRDSDRKERKQFIEAIDKMGSGMSAVASSNKEVAHATTKAANEAEKRNGHLAELIQQGTEQTQQIADAAVQTIVDSVQHVEKQEIEHQHVKEVNTDE